VEEPNTPKKAESLLDLAKLYEDQAAQATNEQQRVLLYRKAAATHHELGSYIEEARCISQVSELLEGAERIDCLVSKWGVYITAIAVYKYETSFEWKGESENLDPHYEKILKMYYDGAVDALDEALGTAGVDREKLFERLYAECVKRRNDGGWGESECFSSLESLKRAPLG
jgi:hypothetical protein